MDLLILTGMSGSGKSKALSTLEDIGYYCIDNFPPQLLLNFTELMGRDTLSSQQIAITVDARSKEKFVEFSGVLDELDSNNVPYSLLFLDCDDTVLLSRYKETRRIHPLMSDEVKHIEEALRLERDILTPIRGRANYYINTTQFSPSQLRLRLNEIFSKSYNGGLMTVHFVSFGFKYGILSDADLVFDVRCLPNPFYVKELREKTGNDQEVQEYVMQFPESEAYFEHIRSLLEFSIPLYQNEGKQQLVIGLGCTGGKHRSATFTLLLAQHFQHHNLRVQVSHRDILKK